MRRGKIKGKLRMEGGNQWREMKRMAGRDKNLQEGNGEMKGEANERLRRRRRQRDGGVGGGNDRPMIGLASIPVPESPVLTREVGLCAYGRCGGCGLSDNAMGREGRKGGGGKSSQGDR